VGRAFAERREEAKAADAFAKAEAGAPGAAELVMARAAFLESRRRFSESRDAWLRLYAQRPDAPEVLAALSRLSLEAGEPDAAEVHLRKLIELAGDLEPYPPEPKKGSPVQEPPERIEARREAAAALLRAGLPLLGARRITSALQAFEAGLRLLPEQPELELYKGLSLLQRGRAKEAAALFDQVAAHATALAAAARAGQPARKEAPRMLLGIEPGALALDAKVQAALARGRAGEVEGSLRRLRAIFGDRPAEGDVALGLLEGFDRAGRAAEASALIAAALQKQPENPQLLFALATALDRSRKLEQALATMRRLLALQPEHAGALNYVGYTLAERGSPQDLAEAEPLLSRAVELRPDDGAVADSFGLLLLKRGRAAEALVELRRADALTPGDPVILSHLGDALLAEGQREEAAAVFRRALGRLQPAEARRRSDGARRERTASSRPRADSTREAPEEEPDGADRLPEPGDARVRAELEAKLRSCCAPASLPASPPASLPASLP
jgi:tetratricopeptide (TPR) repeat protein